MILVLGGTTEGRAAVQALEEAGSLFYYSTRGDEQRVELHHGLRLTGGMNADEMKEFCRSHHIRLLVDAAHPFAQMLHHTIQVVSACCQIPVIRLERIYPDLSGYDITWCKDYDEAVSKVKESGVSSLLLLTGVQTIARLKSLWQSDLCCWCRILDRDSSRELARKEGFPLHRLCFYASNATNQEVNDREVMAWCKPEAVLMKESGLSGGFLHKVEVAHSLGIRVFVVQRPALPTDFITVDGVHGLRRAVEKYLPDFYPLHSGLTTGTCATAACLATVYNCMGQSAEQVPVRLPNGETIEVSVAEVNQGTATVMKESGDDPDITNGTAICAKMMFEGCTSADYEVVLHGGEGVGVVTLPGLGLPVGGPAINACPRKMMTENLLHTLHRLHAPLGRYLFTISVPEGRLLAERTFNPRLGVMGGISIIGTSGIIKPFSSDAFVLSIRKSMEVACATGSPCVVINSGAKSERFLHACFPDLPRQAFVHYGNFIGETLKIASELQVPKLVMGLMIGKAVKLAEGHMDTHSKHTVMNKEFIAQMAREAGCSTSSVEAVQHLTLARELWTLLAADELAALIRCIIELCTAHSRKLYVKGELSVALISEEGKVYF